jgi:hypothetical protein
MRNFTNHPMRYEAPLTHDVDICQSLISMIGKCC